MEDGKEQDELVTMLKLVHKNIYLLVQEWNSLTTSLKYQGGTCFQWLPIINILDQNENSECYQQTSTPNTNTTDMHISQKASSVTASAIAGATKSMTTQDGQSNVVDKSEDISSLQDSQKQEIEDENIPGSQIMLASGSRASDHCTVDKNNTAHRSADSDRMAPSDVDDPLPTIHVEDFVLSELALEDYVDPSTHHGAISELAAIPSSLGNFTPRATEMHAAVRSRPHSVSFEPEGHRYQNHTPSSCTEWLQVRAADIDRLTAEAMMMKEYLPKVVNPHYMSCVRRVPLLEGKLGEARREREKLSQQCRNLRRKCDVVMADLEEGRKELFSVKGEVCELRALLAQQADYCSSMGSSCCMLLWRLSRHEECIQSILTGTKVKDFLELASSTLLSFLDAYRDSAFPEETSSELQFVLALCGTITNIAACTYGREFLSSCDDGRKLIDAFCSAVVTTPYHPNW